MSEAGGGPIWTDPANPPPFDPPIGEQWIWDPKLGRWVAKPSPSSFDAEPLTDPPDPPPPPGPPPPTPSTGNWKLPAGCGILVFLLFVILLYSCTRPKPPPPGPTTPTPSASTQSIGPCNGSDVRLTVTLYGRSDIGMTYRDQTSSSDQTSWNAGNPPFPNSFPKFPAPWLRYGCFHPGAAIHLTFHDSDEPWVKISRTAGPGCNRSRPLQKGRTYTAAELLQPLTCDLVIKSDTALTAYWAEPTFEGSKLTDFAEFPACLPGPANYCPRG